MNVQALIMAKSQQMNSKQWSIFLACFQIDQFYYSYSLCSFGWFEFTAISFDWVQIFG